MSLPNGRASNKQVADLLSMVKELYALQNKQILDYTTYAFACKLQDFPSQNRFVHINQPFQADNPLFPEDAEGHPCFMVVERPSITPPVELSSDLKPWLLDPRDWTNATLHSDQVRWYSHVVRFQNIPWIVDDWRVHDEGKLDPIDFAAFTENLQRIAQALTLPYDKILPLHSKVYASKDYREQIEKGEFEPQEFVEESLDVKFTVKTWACYTSDPEQLEMLKDLQARLDKLMQQAQDNFIDTPYRECLRRYFAAAHVQSQARSEIQALKSQFAAILRLRDQWLKQRAAEKDADKLYKLLESKLHDIERSGDGLELIAATGLLRQQPYELNDEASKPDENAEQAQTDAANSRDVVAEALAYTAMALGDEPVASQAEVADKADAGEADESEKTAGGKTKKRLSVGRSSKKDEGINHPVLLRRVRLEQDATFGNGRILLFDNAERCELCSTLFTNFSGNYTVLESDYTDVDLYPWDEQKSNAFLKKLANSLGSNCYFNAQFDATSVAKRYGSAHAAEICYFPLLIMRSRKMALPSAVDMMVKQVQDEGEKWRKNEAKSIVPVVVRDLVSQNSISTFAASAARAEASGESADATNANAVNADSCGDGGGNFDYELDDSGVVNAPKLARYLNRLDGVSSEILLTKPANNEQLQIAENIERASAVLVQGPPGTGKTHTIANLLGHFLSQGKTVLVISENSKALRVLKDKVEPQLQDLCISILDESNADTIQALQGIIERFSQMEQSISSYRHHTASLKQEREHICQELTTLRQHMAEQEGFEYQHFKVGNNEITTSQAAQGVSAYQTLIAKVLPPIQEAKPDCPLTLEELQRLYATNATVSAALESHMLDIIPALDKLLSPQDFTEQVRVYQQAMQHNRELMDKFQHTINPHWHSSFRWDFSKVNIVVSNGTKRYAVPFANLAADKVQPLLKDWDEQIDSASKLEKHAMMLSWQRVLKQHPELVSHASANLMAGALEREFQCFRELIALLQQYDAMKGKLGIELAAYHFQLLSYGVPDDGVVLDESLAKELAQLLNAQKTRIQNPAGRFSPNIPLRLAQLIQVNGHEFKLASECEQAIRWLHLELQRQRCARQWNFLLVPWGEPTFEALDPTKQHPELMALAKLTQVERCLNWSKLKFRPFFDALISCGLRLEMFYEPDFAISPDQDFERLIQAFQKLPQIVQLCQDIAKTRQHMLPMQRYAQSLKHELQQANEALLMNAGGAAGAVVTGTATDRAAGTVSADAGQKQFKQRLQFFTYFVKALVQFNVKEYTRFYKIIQAINQSRTDFQVRQDLLRRLQQVDPEWAKLINAREGVYGSAKVTPRIIEAWQWRNVACELKKVEGQSLNTLQAQAAQAAQQYREKTTEYAASLAWEHMFKRLNDSVSGVKALRQVSSLLEQIGDGTRTGKRVKNAQKDLKQVLPQCKALIPVWIMPLARVFENFTVDQRKFDVLIVDEASQVKIYGLAALFLAKKCIIVGDDKQVSPTFFRVTDEQQMAVINKYKSSLSLPSFYNLEKSLYDLAKVDYSSIMLREHFRCVPEIINFCNLQFYDNRIKILRDATSSQLLPAVLEYYVPEGQRDEMPGRARTKTNYIEALHTVALLKACFDNQAYANKSFGVIVMLGSEQIELIESLISQYIPLIEQQKHDLRCGGPAEFQGDEREVILMCLVDSLALDAKQDAMLTVLNHRKKIDVGQRYNVAVSRARDQLWVVSSIDMQRELKPEDIRFQLLSYAQNPAVFVQDSSALDQSIHQNSESDFEKRMAFCLKKLGYTFEQQYQVGSYRLDFVVKYHNHQIALECDGDRFHSSDAQVAHDLERQTILERLGWRFVRIRGSQFYRYPKLTLKRMMDEFKRLGILPEYAQAQPQAQSQDQPQNLAQSQSQTQAQDNLAQPLSDRAGDEKPAEDANVKTLSGKVVGDTSRHNELVHNIVKQAQVLLEQWNDAEYGRRLEIYRQHKLLRAMSEGAFEPDNNPPNTVDLDKDVATENANADQVTLSENSESLANVPVATQGGSEVAAESKAKSPTESQVESDSKVEPKTDVASESKIEPESKAEAHVAPEPQVEAESKTYVESDSDVEPKADIDDDSEVKADSKTTDDVKADESKADSENESENDFDLKAEAKADSENDFELKDEDKPDSAAMDEVAVKAWDVSDDDMDFSFMSEEFAQEVKAELERKPQHLDESVENAYSPEYLEKIESGELSETPYDSADLARVTDELESELETETESAPEHELAASAAESAIEGKGVGDEVSDGANGTISELSIEQDNAVDDGSGGALGHTGALTGWQTSPMFKQKRKRTTSDFVKLFEERNLKCLNGQFYNHKEIISLKPASDTEAKGLRTYCNKLQRCRLDAKRLKLQCVDQIKDQALLSIYLPAGNEKKYLYNLESSGLLFVREKPHSQWFVNVRPKSFGMFLKLWRQVTLPDDAH